MATRRFGTRRAAAVPDNTRPGDDRQHGAAGADVADAPVAAHQLLEAARSADRRASSGGR